MTALTLRTELAPEQREYLEMVRASADALLTLINDLLDFSKIEAGRLDIEPVPFALAELVEGESIRALTMRAEAAGLAVSRSIAADVPARLIGDPLRLTQVLVNLFGNAIKFTKRGSVTISVQVERQDIVEAVLRVAVTDTGIGIPKDKQELIFEAFSQADGSTTRKYGGTGLGLAICKQLVDLMGGELGVESEPNKGATFWFTMRFQKDTRRESYHSAEEFDEAAPKLRPLAILVAEDNAVNRTLLARLLESEGHVVTLVSNGREVLDVVEKNKFDVVLMDVQMPEMDGFEATKIIREREKQRGGAHLPLVAVTAHAMKGDRERCLAAGYDAYVTKPIAFDALFDVLREMLPAERIGGPITPRSRAPLSSGNAFDEVAAVARAGGDRTLFLELLALFLDDVPNWLTELDAAAGEGDADRLRRLAHTIKGAADTCGVRGAVESALAIERLAAQAKLDREAVAVHSTNLRAAIDAALPAMRAKKGTR